MLNLREFDKQHTAFFDLLADDTFLCDKPIPESEVRACWRWVYCLKEEDVPEDKFEETYGITFKEITDWWNKEILKVE